MKLDTVHHIAIIGSNYENTREFYVEKLGFEQLDEHIRPEKKDILFKEYPFYNFHINYLLSLPQVRSSFLTISACFSSVNLTLAL